MPPGMKVKIASGWTAAIWASSAEKVELPEGREHLARDPAGIGPLEPRQRVLARLVVGRHQEHVLEPLCLGIGAHDLVVLVVLVGRDEEVGIALGPGEVRRARVGADQDGAAFGHGFVDRDQDVGEDRAHDEIDPVALDQFARLVGGHIGLLFVVHDDQLHGTSTQGAALLERKLESVAPLLAECCGGPREGEDEPDLQRLLRRRGPRRQPARDQRRGADD